MTILKDSYQPVSWGYCFEKEVGPDGLLPSLRMADFPGNCFVHLTRPAANHLKYLLSILNVASGACADHVVDKMRSFP